MINASAHNLGTESAFGVLARAAALGAAGEDIINLGIDSLILEHRIILLRPALRLYRMGLMATPPQWG